MAAYRPPAHLMTVRTKKIVCRYEIIKRVFVTAPRIHLAFATGPITHVQRAWRPRAHMPPAALVAM